MADIQKKLEPLVKSILQKKKKVTFFQGAGISTAAGIPDFRSPETGLYANLAKLNLPYAEAVFDISYFRDDPKAFYTLADELYPGKFVPTKFHYLVKLFQDKKLLRRVYTQNIDTLERIAGVEDEYIVEAHGSFAKNHCIDCSKGMSSETLREHMNDKDERDGIPTCPDCKGYVKPDITFFGEGLPPRFFDKWDDDADEVDIAIVAGTSLTVYPFAALPSEVGKKTSRVLINKENVGDFKDSPRKSDIVLLSDCDEAAVSIAKALGWEKDLEKLVSNGNKTLVKEDMTEKPQQVDTSLKEKEEKVVNSVSEALQDRDKKKQETNDNETTKLQETNDDETKKLQDDLSKLKI